MGDRGLRELERQAALGDQEAARRWLKAIERLGGFLPCVACGMFYPAYLKHDCTETGGYAADHLPYGRRPAVSRELIYDSEYYDGESQASLFVNYSSFNSVRPGRVKAWGVDTNLSGQSGIYSGYVFHVHRVAVLLPSGLDAPRRDWLRNTTYVQLRFASLDMQTIPGLVCYRDEESDRDEWVIQIAGTPPEDFPVEERRCSEGLRGIDLTVNGRAGFVLDDFSAFRVILGTNYYTEWREQGFSPVLIRVVFAGILARREA
jgi:hypothetical protein